MQMSSPTAPPLPAGYKLDQPPTSHGGLPPVPAGYQIDHPPLPPGYTLDQAHDTNAFATTNGQASGHGSGNAARGAAAVGQTQPQKSIWGQLLDLRDSINDAETRMAKGAAEDIWGVVQGVGSLVKPPDFMLHPIAQRPKTVGQAVSQGAQAGAYTTGLTTVGRAAKGYYDATRQNIQRAEQAADRGDTTGVWINSAAAGLPLVGPLIGGLYEDAQTKDLPTMAGRGISRIGQAMSMAPERSFIPNPVRLATKGAGSLLSKVGDQTHVSRAAPHPVRDVALEVDPEQTPPMTSNGPASTLKGEAAGTLEEAAAEGRKILGIGEKTRLRLAEQATVPRLVKARPDLRLRVSEHEGAEYIDQDGNAYDQIGDPRTSQYWNAKQFLNSIDEHLLKSKTTTVVDMTYFTKDQIAIVEKYINSLPEESQRRIIKIGF